MPNSTPNAPEVKESDILQAVMEDNIKFLMAFSNKLSYDMPIFYDKTKNQFYNLLDWAVDNKYLKLIEQMIINSGTSDIRDNNGKSMTEFCRQSKEQEIKERKRNSVDQLSSAPSAPIYVLSKIVTTKPLRTDILVSLIQKKIIDGTTPVSLEENLQEWAEHNDNKVIIKEMDNATANKSSNKIGDKIADAIINGTFIPGILTKAIKNHPYSQELKEHYWMTAIKSNNIDALAYFYEPTQNTEIVKYASVHNPDMVATMLAMPNFKLSDVDIISLFVGGRIIQRGDTRKGPDQTTSLISTLVKNGFDYNFIPLSMIATSRKETNEGTSYTFEPDYRVNYAYSFDEREKIKKNGFSPSSISMHLVGILLEQKQYKALDVIFSDIHSTDNRFKFSMSDALLNGNLILDMDKLKTEEGFINIAPNILRQLDKEISGLKREIESNPNNEQLSNKLNKLNKISEQLSTTFINGIAAYTPIQLVKKSDPFVVFMDSQLQARKYTNCIQLLNKLAELSCNNEAEKKVIMQWSKSLNSTNSTPGKENPQKTKLRDLLFLKCPDVFPQQHLIQKLGAIKKIDAKSKAAYLELCEWYIPKIQNLKELQALSQQIKNKNLHSNILTSLFKPMFAVDNKTSAAIIALIKAREEQLKSNTNPSTAPNIYNSKPPSSSGGYKAS